MTKEENTTSLRDPRAQTSRPVPRADEFLADLRRFCGHPSSQHRGWQMSELTGPHRTQSRRPFDEEIHADLARKSQKSSRRTLILPKILLSSSKLRAPSRLLSTSIMAPVNPYEHGDRKTPFSTRPRHGRTCRTCR